MVAMKVAPPVNRCSLTPLPFGLDIPCPVTEPSELFQGDRKLLTPCKGIALEVIVSAVHRVQLSAFPAVVLMAQAPKLGNRSIGAAIGTTVLPLLFLGLT